MRVMSFRTGDRKSFGIVSGDGVIDAGVHLDGRFSDLRDLLQKDGIDQLRAIADREPDYALTDLRFLPVICNPAAKFLCVGVNYMPHIREMGRERPDYPVIFVRFSNSLTGHEERVYRPRNSECFDFEGELVVVIGKRAHHVARAEALDHVAGYSCLMDGSVRDFQRHGLQWTPGKNFVRSGALGPWMVTTDEIPDAGALELTTLLNGEVMQHESVSELCFGIPELIEYITSWTELEPGDVIATGTPGGVGGGRKPPLWMRPGDVVEVDISGIGRLRNEVAAEDVA